MNDTLLLKSSYLNYVIYNKFENVERFDMDLKFVKFQSSSAKLQCKLDVSIYAFKSYHAQSTLHFLAGCKSCYWLFTFYENALYDVILSLILISTLLNVRTIRLLELSDSGWRRPSLPEKKNRPPSPKKSVYTSV